MEDEIINKKIFVDAAQSFGGFIFWGILGLPLFLMWYIPVIRTLRQVKFVIYYDKTFVVLVALCILFPLFLLVTGYAALFKYGIYRNITTDDKGITFSGIFKQSQIQWKEILSLEIDNSKFTRFARNTIGRIKIAKLLTSHGSYYFPLSMKEKGDEYPSWYRMKLIDKDYNRIKEISPSECPLFVEIQEHISKG